MLTTLWRHWWPMLGGIGYGLVILVPIVMFMHALDPTEKERQVCRQAIDTFWTTNDLVEFERSKFLIEQVRGCRLRP
jgi:hypothetical protein